MKSLGVIGYLIAGAVALGACVGVEQYTASELKSDPRLVDPSSSQVVAIPTPVPTISQEVREQRLLQGMYEDSWHTCFKVVELQTGRKITDQQRAACVRQAMIDAHQALQAVKSVQRGFDYATQK